MIKNNNKRDVNISVQRILILTLLAAFTFVHFDSVKRIYISAALEMISVIEKILGMRNT
jgi:hypothetical protein